MKLNRTGEILLLVVCLGMMTAASAQKREGGQLFGDWVVHCETKAEENLGCKMSQMAVVEATSEPLLRINIRYTPQTRQSFIQFVLPLGVSLHEDPRLILDGELATVVKLDMCLQDGCYSTYELQPDVLEQLLRMQSGSLEIHAGNGEPVSLPLSGNGSRAAFGAMRTMSERLQARQSG